MAMAAALVMSAIVAANGAWAAGTVPADGLGAQNGQYVQPGSSETKVDWPYGLRPILHLRTYYFDAESFTGAQSVAWALGGWAGLTTGFFGNVFQIGIVGYTSQRLYDEDEGGTQLLRPPQEPINVIGEAFGAVKLFDQTFVGYRQLVNRPFVNQHDSRMVPNIFEGYTLRGSPGEWSYIAGYLTKIKVRDSDSYVWMSQQAGTESQEGMALVGVTIPLAGAASCVSTSSSEGRLQHGVRRRAVADCDRRGHVDLARRAVLPAEFRECKSARRLLDLGSWSHGDPGLARRHSAGCLHANRQGPRHPKSVGRASVVRRPHAGRVQYGRREGVAGRRFARLGPDPRARTFGWIQLTRTGRTENQHDQRRALPDRYETNVRADYVFPFAKGHVLHGLSATIRYSWLHEDGEPQVATQLRAYLDYSVPLRW